MLPGFFAVQIHFGAIAVLGLTAPGLRVIKFRQEYGSESRKAKLQARHRRDNNIPVAQINGPRICSSTEKGFATNDVPSKPNKLI